MIIAGFRYRSDEVAAARRLLRELGQPERALRSVLEFVRREHVAAGAAAAAKQVGDSAHATQPSRPIAG